MVARADGGVSHAGHGEQVAEGLQVASRLALSFEQGQQGATVHLPGGHSARPGQDGGRQVLQLHEFVQPPGLGVSGVEHQQRDVQDGLVQQLVAHHAVLQQQLAVVGGDDDDGVIGEARSLQGGQDARDRAIVEAQAAVIAAGHGSCAGGLIRPLGEELGGLSEILDQTAGQGVEGGLGGGGADPRHGAVQVDVVDHGEEGGLSELVQPGHHVGVVGGAVTRGPASAVLEATGALGQQTLVGDAPEHRGLVLVVPQHLRQGGQALEGGRPGLELPRRVRLEVGEAPGEQGPQGRGGPAGWGIGRLEHHAAILQRVQGRGDLPLVLLEAVEPQGVDVDEQDVGGQRLGRWRRRCLRGGLRRGAGQQPQGEKQSHGWSVGCCCCWGGHARRLTRWAPYQRPGSSR